MNPTLQNHPCFNYDARNTHARVHLPVAPACNVQCRFCDRKFDCANESRPGVTSAVLTPAQAMDYLARVRARTPHLSVVGIAGPGDPFANAAETMDTLRGVRTQQPDLLLCVATNGLAIGPHLEELARLEVSHVTVTVNAIESEIGAKVYAWMRDGARVLRGVEAAALLWERQAHAIEWLSKAGILVKVNSIIIPGVNDAHIPAIAARVKALGAQIMNCIPIYPASGTEFGSIVQPAADMVERIRREAGAQLPQMTHCARCRADACGRIGEATAPETAADLLAVSRGPRAPGERRPHIAVASREGLLVNQHLGEAEALHVFAAGEAGSRRVDLRITPLPGAGQRRWELLAESLRDCRTLLVGGVGPTPRRILEASGLNVLEVEGLIDDALRELFAGHELPAAMKRRFRGCGTACSANGQGCG